MIPPKGLIPKEVRIKERFVEVCEAISIFNNAGFCIPIKWVKEHNELIEKYRYITSRRIVLSKADLNKVRKIIVY